MSSNIERCTYEKAVLTFGLSFLFSTIQERGLGRHDGPMNDCAVSKSPLLLGVSVQMGMAFSLISHWRPN